MDMDALAVASVFIVIFLLAMLFFMSRPNPEEEAKQRLERMTRREDDELDVAIMRKPKPEDGKWLEPLRGLNLLTTLEENLWQAGIYVRLSDMLLIMLLLFGAGLAAGELAWGDLGLSTLAGLGASLLPVIYVRFRRSRRLKAFAAQLPYALDLIKSSLEAGHSLQRALQVLVGEFSEPLGSEFRTVLEQTRIGLPLNKALEEMLKRVPAEDLRLLIVAVKVQSDVGSSLAPIVGRLSEIVRTRQRLKLQIRALTSQSRLGGMIVGVLPIVVMAAFSFIQPGYLDSLLKDPTGLKILKIAIGLDVSAMILIRKLVQVKY